MDKEVTMRQEASLTTRVSLLSRLKDRADQESWREFFDLYWQLIYGAAIKSGLTETEAQDAVQDTLLAVVQNIKQFQPDRERCSFKGWLMMLTRQRIIWQLRQRLPVQRLDEGSDGDTRTAAIERVADENAVNLEAFWDEEWQNNLLAAAVEQVKGQVSPRQFQIFDLYALQNWPVEEVARTLGISSGQVYLAKHRVACLSKKAVARLERKNG
jgi:RNA polymerase sigma factor (sigma-70 family)